MIFQRAQGTRTCDNLISKSRHYHSAKLEQNEAPEDRALLSALAGSRAYQGLRARRRVLLHGEVKGMIPRSYVVTLEENVTEKLRSQKINAAPIITSASFFISVLKKELVQKNLMLPDDIFVGTQEALDKVAVEHFNTAALGFLNHPDSIYSLVYQDGLAHAFQHILNNRHAGAYSDPQKRMRTVESYEYIVEGYLSARNYVDAAYFTGYLNGQSYLLADRKQRMTLPLYSLFGYGDIRNIREYLKLEKRAAELHKTAHKLAVRLSQNIGSNQHVLHHPPFF